MEKIIELKKVTAGYNDNIILENINLDIYKKDFLGVIGPNGGGKTTLLKVILGLLKPIKGKVKYFLNGNKDYKRTIGYLPQFHKFDFDFPIKVMDVILSGTMPKISFLNNHKDEDLSRAEDLMKLTGTTSLKKRPLGELSGGQAQRVFLCRALINNPELLILDEPNTFVDKDFSKNLFEILKELNKEISIILVSHDLGIVSSYVKNIACVNGNLHYHDSHLISEDIIKDYRCPVDIITHGEVPHRVLGKHKDK